MKNKNKLKNILRCSIQIQFLYELFNKQTRQNQFNIMELKTLFSDYVMINGR